MDGLGTYIGVSVNAGATYYYVKEEYFNEMILAQDQFCKHSIDKQLGVVGLDGAQLFIPSRSICEIILSTEESRDISIRNQAKGDRNESNIRKEVLEPFS